MLGLTEVFEVGLTAPGARPATAGDAIDEPILALLINPTIDAGIRLIDIPEEEPPVEESEVPPPVNGGVGGDDEDAGDGAGGDQASGTLPWTGSNPMKFVLFGLVSIAVGVIVRYGPSVTRAVGQRLRS